MRGQRLDFWPGTIGFHRWCAVAHPTPEEASERLRGGRKGQEWGGIVVLEGPPSLPPAGVFGTRAHAGGAGGQAGRALDGALRHRFPHRGSLPTAGDVGRLLGSSKRDGMRAGLPGLEVLPPAGVFGTLANAGGSRGAMRPLVGRGFAAPRARGRVGLADESFWLLAEAARLRCRLAESYSA